MHSRVFALFLSLLLTTSLGSAAPVFVTFSAPLTPEMEIPPPDLSGATDPSGSASAVLTYDDADLTLGGILLGTLSWSGLTSTATMAHIHAINNPTNCRPDLLNCGTGPVLIPLFNGTFGPSDSVDIDVELTEPQLNAVLAGLQLVPPADGALYFNVHTQQNPPGEIRGDITGFQVVPEPGTYALLGAGFLVLAMFHRPRA